MSRRRAGVLTATTILVIGLAGCEGNRDTAVEVPTATGADLAVESTLPDTTVARPTEPPTTPAPPTTPPTTAPPSQPNSESSLQWTPCDDQPLGVPTRMECTALVVPRDHQNVEGEAIEIAVARFDTADDDDQLGSLVLNPGGPGGSGIEFLQQAIFFIPPEVQERFDLVSFDPRGVGASTAFDCDIPIDDQVELLGPADEEKWAELVARAESIPELCTAEAYELAGYLGTNNAARDLDLLRIALGEAGLTYVGYSYGTRLGATYAELFPDNVRALVLDGAVKPSTDFAATWREQAAGFDRALENFAAACDADPDCLLREIGPTLDVIAGLRSEISEVGSFATDDPDRVLTPGELELGIAAALYSKEAWPFLAQGLYVAETEADGSLLQVLGDGLVGRKPDGSYDNSDEANAAINCADDPARPTVDEVRAIADAAADATEHFTDFARADTGCIGLPEPLDPLTIGPAQGAPPILVIGSTGDPATPYEWAEELAAFLDSGVLYTVEAEGHTAYGSIDCVADAVNAYLIDLTVPADGTSCADDDGTDFFVPAGEGQVDQLLEFLDCLRENGLDVPELTAADILADPMGETFTFLDDPAFAVAAQSCFEFLPSEA